MSKYGNYTPMRSDNRKKRKLNTILNLSIGVVALLIVVVSATLLLGNGQDEAAVSDNNNELNNEENAGDLNISTDSNENEVNNNNENEANQDNVNNNSAADADEENLQDTGNEENNEDNNNDNNSGNSEDNGESDNNEGENNSGSEENGEWGPIGTVQEEPFSATYDKSHVNWEEMTRAMSYATGIDSDEMTVWWIGNGGDHQTAVGTVGTSDDPHNPYEVTLSWVEHEGWKPVKVEQKDSNPYTSQ